MTFNLQRSLATIMAALALSGTVAAGATPEQNARFINQAYEDLLGRPVDRVAAASLGHLLSIGGIRTQVAGLITSSSEYRSRLVQQSYEQYLSRPATPVESSSGVNLLQIGGTDNQLRGQILADQEYYALAGGSNDGFLSKMFLDVLGRRIDRVTLTALLGQMGNGFTRAMVASEILNSAECDQRMVQQFYQKFLRRAAVVAEIAAYVQVLQNAIQEEVVIDSIVGSDEYFKLANQ